MENPEQWAPPEQRIGSKTVQRLYKRPTYPNTTRWKILFIRGWYADDAALAIQSNDFEEVERKMNTYLQTMLDYYQKNHLKPNPDKTQVCAFHLRNRQAHQKLKITWQGKELEYTTFPKY